MDGQHGPFDIPIVGMVDDCEDAGADSPSLTGFHGDGDANGKRLQPLTSGASRELVFDPLIARIQLELFGRGLPQRPRGSVGSHNFGSKRLRLDARRGQKWTPYHPHVTTRGTRVERPMRATAASLAAAASGDGGSACANLANAAP